MKQRMKHTTTLITTHKGYKVPIILTLNEENPTYSKIALLYMHFKRRSNRSIIGLEQRAKKITLLMDYYLAYPPITTAKKRTFLEDFLKALKTKSVLNWDTLTNNTTTQAVETIKDFCVWVVKHQDLVEVEEQEFAQTLK